MEPSNAYAQKEDGWCGPAVLSYALHEQGVEVPQEKLVKETHTTKGDGVDPYPLEECAQEHGMDTHVIRGGNPKDTIEILKFYIKNGWSVILDYLAGDSYEDGHYVLLRDVTNEGLRVFDPSNGGSEKALDRENFIEHWKDKDEEGDVLKYFALCLTKKIDD